jgi:hypothetical protein
MSRYIRIASLLMLVLAIAMLAAEGPWGPK